jgi:hypothetical protein
LPPGPALTSHALDNLLAKPSKITATEADTSSVSRQPYRAERRIELIDCAKQQIEGQPVGIFVPLQVRVGDVIGHAGLVAESSAEPTASPEPVRPRRRLTNLRQPSGVIEQGGKPLNSRNSIDASFGWRILICHGGEPRSFSDREQRRTHWRIHRCNDGPLPTGGDQHEVRRG